jgi:arabinofuranan 3-O-arabinosyltransferase
VWRLRAAAICALLTGLAFIQQPGVIAEDTKVDLAVNPIGWLARALHMWNPNTNFGQIQNQEYGYWWPMGPVFALGHTLGVPAWATQRAWWALLMCVAFVGAWKLADRMGIGTPASQLIAGLAFALCPRILTEVGAVSAEAWPTAVAPWVLLPLIPLAKGGPVLRGVTLSALAVACAGGINATAVFATALLPGLWLLTLQPVRRRLFALAAWAVAVLMACAWWMIPLWLLGRYSPPFLDYIETATVTTRVTDLVSTLRGTSAWLAYGKSWPAGRALLTDGLLVAVTLAVAGLGLAGLARKGIPHRHFLVAGLLAGVALVGMGHVAAVDGLFADQVRAFLDGAGSPLRNVHKFDLVLRLPLLLGLAHLLGSFQRAAAVAGPGWHLPRRRAATIMAATLAILTLTASPALAGNLPPTGGFEQVPGYWPQATKWLDDRLGQDRALVVPAARFPGYQWGTPADEITQPLMTGGWVVRSAIPLTPPDTIRLLDSVETILANGQGSPGLAAVLARSGVRYLLLRSDLDYGKTRTTPPAIAQHAIAASPGLVRVAGFGPLIGGGNRAGHYVDNGLDTGVQALQVYQVQARAERVVSYDLSDVTTVVGGPESLLNLASAGQLGDGPAVLAGDLPAGVTPGRTVLTDDLRRREVTFGLLHDNTSATMSADDGWHLAGPAHDYLPAWAAGQQSTETFYGLESVTASSSWGQAQPLVGARPEHQPFAAVDGDVTTSWRTPPNVVAAGQFLELVLDRPRQVNQVEIIFDSGADNLPTKVTVTSGPNAATVSTFSDRVLVSLPGSNVTTHIRITIDAVIGVRTGQGAVGIAEVRIPGVFAQRSLLLPQLPAAAGAGADAVVLTAAPSSPACYFLGQAPRCESSLARGSEDGASIDRSFDLPIGAAYQPALQVRARPGAALNALLDKEVAAHAPLGLGPTVTASSSAFDEPATRAGAAVDDDPATAWFPSTEDTAPWLKLQWPTARTLTGLKIVTDPAIASAKPWRVTVFGDGGTRYGVINDDGVLTFDAPMTTDKLTVLFRVATPAYSLDPYQGTVAPLPIAVGEIQALPRAATPPIAADHVVQFPCGAGPALRINGVTYASSVAMTWAQLMRGEAAPAQLCGPSATAASPRTVELSAGANRVVASGSALTVPVQLSLSRAGSAGPTGSGSAGELSVTTWGGTDRSVRLPAASTPRLLVMRENTSVGWRATLGTTRLAPIVVDGWQQGWLVPAGADGTVQITFAPDRTYRIGLLIGLGLLAALVLGAIVLSLRRQAWRARHLQRQISHRTPGGFLVVAVGALALLSVGGYVALLIGALAGAASLVLFFQTATLSARSQRMVRRVLRAGWWLTPAVCLMVAGYLWWSDFRQPGVDPHTSAWPQAVAVAGLGTLWVSTVLGRRPFGKWLAALISGRSTR